MRGLYVFPPPLLSTAAESRSEGGNVVSDKIDTLPAPSFGEALATWGRIGILSFGGPPRRAVASWYVWRIPSGLRVRIVRGW